MPSTQTPSNPSTPSKSKSTSNQPNDQSAPKPAHWANDGDPGVAGWRPKRTENFDRTPEPVNPATRERKGLPANDPRPEAETLKSADTSTEPGSGLQALRSQAAGPVFVSPGAAEAHGLTGGKPVEGGVFITNEDKQNQQAMEKGEKLADKQAEKSDKSTEKKG